MSRTPKVDLTSPRPFAGSASLAWPILPAISLSASLSRSIQSVSASLPILYSLATIPFCFSPCQEVSVLIPFCFSPLSNRDCLDASASLYSASPTWVPKSASPSLTCPFLGLLEVYKVSQIQPIFDVFAGRLDIDNDRITIERTPTPLSRAVSRTTEWFAARTSPPLSLFFFLSSFLYFITKKFSYSIHWLMFWWSLFLLLLLLRCRNVTS